jgi:glycosyltransferase involved in cell wall biosynthesis
MSLGYPREKIHIVPHGIDYDTFQVLEMNDLPSRMREIRKKLNIRSSERVVIYAGTMSLTAHAVDLLLEAFKKVSTRIPNAKLILVGGGEDLDVLIKYSQRLQIENHVLFVGMINRNEIPYYYRLGELSVDPKRSTTLSHTLMPLKVFESIAAMVPCVAADVGETKNIIGKAGLVVKPGSSDSIANGIIYLLENENILSSMIENTTEIKENFKWENLIRDFLKLYDSTN